MSLVHLPNLHGKLLDTMEVHELSVIPSRNRRLRKESKDAGLRVATLSSLRLATKFKVLKLMESINSEFMPRTLLVSSPLLLKHVKRQRFRISSLAQC